MKYEVDVEDVAFTADTTDPKAADHEITEEEARGYTDQALAEGLFPEGVLALLAASSDPDDSVYPGGRDEDGGIKAFVRVRLLIEAKDEGAAMATAENRDLLSRIVDGFFDDGLGLENNWESVDAEEHKEDVTPSAIQGA